MLAPLLLTLAACQNVELAQLETSQHELDDRHDAVARQVQELREDMIELGMVSRQKAVDAGGPRAQLNMAHQLPATELTAALPWTVERTGEPSPLPELPEPERTDTPCGWKYKVEALKPISDFVLNSSDLGKSSPLVLFEDGAPLKAHAFPKQFEQSCGGAFRHAGFVVLFSPTGDSPEAIEDHDYTLGLSSELPLLRGDDNRGMYWVYPGTTVTFTLSEGWSEDWGELWVDIAGRATAAASPLEITIADESFPIETADVAISTQPDMQQDAWTITLTSPADGPFAILDVLTIGNAENALVITGPRAFKKEQKP